MPTSITLTGHYVQPNGNPATGRIRVALDQTLHTASGGIYPPVELLGVLNGSGIATVVVIATDDAGTLPLGGTWHLTEEIDGRSPLRAPRSFSFAVPANSPGGVLDLATVAPALTDPAYAYVLLSVYTAHLPAHVPTGGTTGQVLAKTSGADYAVGWAAGGGGGGGPPTGAAGGVLGGTYPNPAFAVDMATQAELDSEATTRATAITTEATTRASADSTLTSALSAHTGNTSNPHATTAAQVGAPTTAAFTAHTGNVSNPHAVTAAQASAFATANNLSEGTPATMQANLGLGNVATLLGAVARLLVSKAGTLTGTRRGINFIEGSGATLTITDNPGSERVDVTISATGTGGTVTAVSGTPPIVSSGGTTPALSITAASGGAAGSMSSADFTKLAGVASGATANSPDATLVARANHTGTQADSTLVYAAQARNLVWAGPASGGATAPTFRVLLSSDLPAPAPRDYMFPMHNYLGAAPYSGAIEALAGRPTEPVSGVAWNIGYYVGGTNDGANYWQFDLKRLTAGVSVVTISTLTTAAGAATAWSAVGTTNFSGNILATDIWLEVALTKIGSPGPLQFQSGLLVRA